MNKDHQCSGCSLNSDSKFWAAAIAKAPPRDRPPLLKAKTTIGAPDGPLDAPLAFMGESLGVEEVEAVNRAAAQTNFVGAAGRVLNKGLTRLGHDRVNYRVGNTVYCRPMWDKLIDRPWTASAIEHCQPRRAAFLNEQRKVIVTLGVTPTRYALEHFGYKYEGAIDNWHGYVIGDQEPYIIPSYHPNFILHDKAQFTYIFYRDIALGLQIAKNGFKRKPVSLIIDPPPDWFARWVDEWNPESWLSVDCETPGKVEGQAEDEITNWDQKLIRMNYSYNPDEGITIPVDSRYMSSIKKLHAKAQATYCLWNERFDSEVLAKHGAPLRGRVLDFMWGWHILQSSLPKKLGFVAPLFSDLEPWKHLAKTDPGTYGAMDGVQELRCAFGIAKLLVKEQQWDVAFKRHIVLRDQHLRAAEHRGLDIDVPKLTEFGKELQLELDRLLEEIRAAIPERALTLTPKNGWVNKPDPEDHPQAFPKEIIDEVQVCITCGETQVSIKHTCKTDGKKDGRRPNIQVKECKVTRWFEVDPFNPASPTHVINFIKTMGYPMPPPGKDAKTEKPGLDDSALEKLEKHDRAFGLMRRRNSISKVKGTYVDGAFSCLEGQEDGRMRGYEFQHNPQTMRLSCSVFPFQGVVADKEGEAAPGAGFRKSVRAPSGYMLLEGDYSAEEAVFTGYHMGDPTFMRLAKLGVHSYLTSVLVKEPADLKWSDDDLGEYFGEMKEKHRTIYDRAKTTVYRTFYGGTPHGMVRSDPKIFPKVKDAQLVQGMLFEVAPRLDMFQRCVREQAKQKNYLGGPASSMEWVDGMLYIGHPFGYKLWLWAMVEWDSKRRVVKFGKDQNKAVSFYPQSDGAGVQAESEITLFSMSEAGGKNWIGDLCPPKEIPKWWWLPQSHANTPLRAPIHDSWFCLVPEDRTEEVADKMLNVMTTPIKEMPCLPEWEMGTHLQLGAEIKVGKSWDAMETIRKVR